MRFHAIVAHGQAAENRLCPQVAQGYVLPEMLIWGRLRTRQSGGPIFRRQYPFGPMSSIFIAPKSSWSSRLTATIMVSTVRASETKSATVS